MSSTSTSLKLNLADLAPLMQRFPSEPRSSVVRGIIYGVACLNAPLPVATLELSPASIWTTISLDTEGELLLDLAFRKGRSKNLSALVYHGIRMPLVFEDCVYYLGLSSRERQKTVRDLLLRTGAFVPEAQPEPPVGEDAAFVFAYLVGEVSRTTKALDEATANHAKASAALDAFRRTLPTT
jgi:hypothetical protein